MFAGRLDTVEDGPLDPWKLTPAELMRVYGMSRALAERRLEELRNGIPPDVVESKEPQKG